MVWKFDNNNLKNSGPMTTVEFIPANPQVPNSLDTIIVNYHDGKGHLEGYRISFDKTGVHLKKTGEICCDYTPVETEKEKSRALSRVKSLLEEVVKTPKQGQAFEFTTADPNKIFQLEDALKFIRGFIQTLRGFDDLAVDSKGKDLVDWGGLKKTQELELNRKKRIIADSMNGAGDGEVASVPPNSDPRVKKRR